MQNRVAATDVAILGALVALLLPLQHAAGLGTCRRYARPAVP